MGAPGFVKRQTPTGTKLNDGFVTKIAFAAKPNVNLWEKTITPPGLDGGAKIDTTTMFNQLLRTYALRQLKEQTDMSFTCAYDPGVLTDLYALVNVPTTVTVRFPNGRCWSFFGGLTKFEPGALEEGKQPEATVTVVATNQDTSGNEQSPVVGTGT